MHSDGVTIYEPSADERRAAERLRRVLDLILQGDAQMNAREFRAFLLVCSKPGLGPMEYARAVGEQQPAMSRTLAAIGHRDRAGSEGLGLVCWKLDPRSDRNHNYHLTEKGRDFLRGIVVLLGW